jgi:hypothetical protein
MVFLAEGSEILQQHFQLPILQDAIACQDGEDVDPLRFEISKLLKVRHDG